MRLNHLGLSVRFPKCGRLTAVLLAIAWTAGSLSPAFLMAQSEDRFRRERGQPGTQSPQNIETNSGYLFLDGEYLAPPYRLEWSRDRIRVNENEYALPEIPKTDDTPSRPWGHFMEDEERNGERFRWPAGRRRPGRRGGFANAPAQGTMEQLANLRQGAIVILESGSRPNVFWPSQRGHEILESLVSLGPESPAVIHLPKKGYSAEERDVCEKLILGFEPTPEFLERASESVASFNNLVEKNERDFSAVQWSQRILYPMTMLALVLVVLAMGHLMAIAQITFSPIAASETLMDSSKMVMRSLMIVGAMSAIDLIWTVMAHQGGAMRELNPIGSRLIAEPHLLVAFKVMVTATSIALLYYLRQQALARKATWWCCLVLTLLTARWLTFHSMLA